MSFGEILLLAVVAYLVLGPRKLPEIARRAAQVMAELRRASNDFRRSLDLEIRGIEVTELPAPPAPQPQPPPLGTGANPIAAADKK